MTIDKIEWKSLKNIKGFEMFNTEEVSNNGIVRRISSQKVHKTIKCRRTGLLRVRLMLKDGYKQPLIRDIVRAGFDKDYVQPQSKESYASNRLLEAILNSEFKSKKELVIALKNEIETIRGMK